MSRVVEALAWLAGIWLVASIYVAIARPFRDEPTPYRTADDVHRDAEEHRRKRELEQLHQIWPDPPSWNNHAAIHRLNTIRQRKEDTP